MMLAQAAVVLTNAPVIVLAALLAIMLVVLPQITTPAQAALTANATTGRLVDEDGRERIFHGMNVVYKGPPYVPITDHFDFQYSFSVEDAQLLQQYGMNAIRLGVMWPGVEPTRDVYNSSYLALIRNITETCNDHGINVLFDMHQDVWNERFCGEGVPAWAAVPSPNAAPFPKPIFPAFNTTSPDHVPSPADCAKHSWSEYYFTAEVGSSVQRLYDNEDGLLDKFAAFWGKVAQEFGDMPNIIGYELINEPWAGDATKDPLLMVPGVADRVNLQKVYDAANTAIRQYDSHNPVFFETVTWDDIVVGFEHPPGGVEWGNKSVLAYHFYQPPNFSAKETIAMHLNASRRLKCAAFCTETDDFKTLMDAADGEFQSWLHWVYKAFVPKTGYNYGFWNSDGSKNEQAIHALTRTYAKAVAGHGTTMSFNATTSVFTLSFIVDLSIKQPTVVWASEDLHYPEGLAITVAPSGALTFTKEPHGDIFFFPAATTADRTHVTVTLTQQQHHS